MAEPGSALPRIGYLGPQGTFSEEALLGSVEHDAVEPVPLTTIREAVMAVQTSAVAGALVPIENSIEGSVTVTLDTLAGEACDVRVVADFVLAVRQCLIAAEPIELAAIATVVSHPQATGQCARFLREQLPHARVLAADSTAAAVQTVAGTHDRTWAALGPRLAAAAYGCVILREGVEDHHDNETRFVWLVRRGGAAAFVPPVAAGAHRTSLVFWGPGDDGPGWLVACLDEFARRQVNLTKIESRPRRARLGHYMFFLDAEGSERQPQVAAAVAGLGARCQEVRVLGSYPVAP